MRITISNSNKPKDFKIQSVQSKICQNQAVSSVSFSFALYIFIFGRFHYQNVQDFVDFSNNAGWGEERLSSFAK